MHHRHIQRDGDRPPRSSGGFTLVELFVVMVILAGLVAVVVYSLSRIESKSQKSTCQTGARTIRTAQENKFADDGTYATDLSSLTPTYLDEDPDPDVITAEGTTPTSLLLSYGPACRGISGLVTP